jgi:hypothetical protein
MSEYMILFRLPLRAGSKLDQLLRNDGWLSFNDMVYYRVAAMDREKIIERVKEVCQGAGERAGRESLSAFSVVPVHEHLKHAARKTISRRREKAICN